MLPTTRPQALRPVLLLLALLLVVPVLLWAATVVRLPQLLRPGIVQVPTANAAPTKIVASPERLIYYDFLNQPGTPGQTVTIRNSGLTPLELSFSLTDDSAFRLDGPSTPASIPAQGSLDVVVQFSPNAKGVAVAALRIESDEPGRPQVDVGLRGLGLGAADGKNEPSLQRILETFDYPINVDDPDPDTSEYVTTAQLHGDEIAAQRFLKAGPGAVTVEPIAAFGPTTKDPMVRMGWYRSGDSAAKHEVFSISNSYAKSLNPPLATGQSSFDPGAEAFGLYSIWPRFQPSETGIFQDASYSEDTLNRWEPDPNKRHKLRVFPLKNPDGTIEPNAYVVTNEDTQGVDYQDLVLILRNVKPA